MHRGRLGSRGALGRAAEGVVSTNGSSPLIGSASPSNGGPAGSSPEMAAARTLDALDRLSGGGHSASLPQLPSAEGHQAVAGRRAPLGGTAAPASWQHVAHVISDMKTSMVDAGTEVQRIVEAIFHAVISMGPLQPVLVLHKGENPGTATLWAGSSPPEEHITTCTEGSFTYSLLTGTESDLSFSRTLSTIDAAFPIQLEVESRIAYARFGPPLFPDGFLGTLLLVVRHDVAAPLPSVDQMSVLVRVVEAELSRLFRLRSVDTQRGTAAKLSRLYCSLANLFAEGMHMEKLMVNFSALASDFLQADRTSIFVADDKGAHFWTLSSRYEPELAAVRLGTDSGLVGKCFRAGRPLVVDDAYSDPDFNSQVDSRTGYKTRTTLCVPIHDPERRVIAVIQALNKLNGGFFTESDKVLLGAVADVTGTALLRAKSGMEAGKKAARDAALLRALTILHNEDQALSGSEALQSAIKESLPAMDAAEVAAIVKDADGRWCVLSTTGDGTSMVGRDLAPHIIQAGGDFVCNTSDELNALPEGTLTGAPVHNLMATIIRSRSETVFGALIALNHTRHADFVGADVAFLNAVAKELARALRSREMENTLSNVFDAAQRDPILQETLKQHVGLELLQERGPDRAVRAAHSQSRPRLTASAPQQRVGPSTKGRAKRIKSLFEGLDVDGDGAVSRDDIVQSLSAVGLENSTAVEVFDALAGENAGQEGEITIEVFNTALRDIPTRLLGDLKTAAMLCRRISEDSVKLVMNWDFDILACPRDELENLVLVLFQQHGLLESFSVSLQTFRSFVHTIAGTYRNNPYHNFWHGFQVVHSFLLCCRDSGIQDQLDALETYAIAIAALGHDVDHDGHTNGFHINSGSPLALRYNDSAVLEQHHAATTFSIMARSENNILSTLTAEQRKKARKLAVDTILGTDMSRHFAQVDEMQALAKRGSYSESKVMEEEKTRVAVVVALVHSCDISNPVLRTDLSQAWSKRVMLEFVHQADEEERLGLPVTVWQGPKTLQAGAVTNMKFIDFLVKPIWTALATVFPDLAERVAIMEQNKEAWKVLAESEPEKPLPRQWPLPDGVEL